ncbi:MAG: YdbL family protein [Methylacidiphilales bacterium]|nr:YdbL family protein [Candidatus Methylacidiphilales bacterium]
MSHLYFRAAPPSLVIGACFLGGCSPTINLATPNPIKVDVAVRLDVYQKTAPTKAKEEQSSLEIAANRRLRSGQIQQLKNDGVVGEDRDGYLDLRKRPTDPKYLAYAQSVVDAENADRSFLYLANAQAQNKPLEMIEREYAQLWSDRAFPGEWIQKENGTWIQK